MDAEPSGLTFLVIGLFQGAVYGLLAVGLVLVYKGARVFNFAQGEFGTVAAFVTFALFEQAGIPYGVAVAGGLAAAVVLGLLVERLAIRPLFDAPRVTVLVATVGVALLIVAVTVLVAKPEPRVLPPAISGDPITFAGVALVPQQFLILGVLAALAAVLALFFSRTNLGLAILAISQDVLATRIVGISVPRISRLIWAMAALLGGVAGILQAPLTIFTPGFMTTTTLVPAFTAAVLGGMTSLPGAFVGGLLVGAAQNVGIFYLQRAGIPGASELTVFSLLLVVLLVRPRGLLGK
ncbi:MAG TPA: branched-chain amino acid ABC transporter permease, partial [Actinomycetota bacterium]|nr:branched-chain amino acid ABC transporter permease [Actinomycetota bacterium]